MRAPIKNNAYAISTTPFETIHNKKSKTDNDENDIHHHPTSHNKISSNIGLQQMHNPKIQQQKYKNQQYNTTINQQLPPRRKHVNYTYDKPKKHDTTRIVSCYNPKTTNKNNKTIKSTIIILVFVLLSFVLMIMHGIILKDSSIYWYILFQEEEKQHQIQPRNGRQMYRQESYNTNLATKKRMDDNGSRLELDEYIIKRISDRRKRTTPPPFMHTERTNNSRGIFEPAILTNIPNLSTTYPKCTPQNPCNILITNILSSTLSMGVAISIALQYESISNDSVRIIGIQESIPTTLKEDIPYGTTNTFTQHQDRNRWEYINRLQILKKYNIPHKMLKMPFSGIYPLGMEKEEFRNELDSLDFTHAIHISSNDKGGNSSVFRKLHQSMVSIDQILDYLTYRKRKRGLDPMNFIYISEEEQNQSTTSSTALLKNALKTSNEILANAYYSTYKISSIGLRFPTVFGPWGGGISTAASRSEGGDLIHQYANELIHNSTIPIQSKEEQTDMILNLMPIQDAVRVIFTAMQHSTPGAIVFDYAIQNKNKLDVTINDTTKGLLEEDEILVEKVCISSIREQMTSIWNKAFKRNYSLDEYASMSKFQKTLHQAIGWRYYQMYPHKHGPNNTNKEDTTTPTTSYNNKNEQKQSFLTNNLWKSISPIKFPCISECSNDPNYCSESSLDSFVPFLHKATDQCQYILYTDKFRDVSDTLINVDEYEYNYGIEYYNSSVLNGTALGRFCYVMFTSEDSPLFLSQNNHRLKKNINKISMIQGWITVPIPKESLDVPLSLLIKLSPSKLFSPNVEKAIYYNTKQPPSYTILKTLMDQMYIPHQPSRRKWKKIKKKHVIPTTKEGTTPMDDHNAIVERYRITVPEQTARRTVFMASHYTIKRRKKLSFTDTLDVIRALKYPQYQQEEEEEDVPPHKIGQTQYDFYEMAYELIQNQLYNRDTMPHLHYMEQHYQELQQQEEQHPQTNNKQLKKEKFPLTWIRSAWMAHDLKYGKSFRCDAYHEHLFWNTNTNTNDLLEEWSFMYTFAKWHGIGNLDPVRNENNINGVDEEFNRLRKKDGEEMDEDGAGLYIRILKQPIKPKLPLSLVQQQPRQE